MTDSAVGLRAGSAGAVIEPELGGRITSIRLAGREWLQQPAVALRPATPFDPFVRPDMSGWDEMVPTCVAVDDGGVSLPDHGELWSRPWRTVEVSATLRPLRSSARRYRCCCSGLPGSPPTRYGSTTP